MLRVFAPEGPSDGLIDLGREEAHHLVNVRRVEAGERVEAFDGRGQSWMCEVVEWGRNHCLLRAHSPGDHKDRDANRPEIVIATAVPKGDRFDWLVEKATELGVDRLVPLRCDRSVVDPRDSKIDRLRQLVIESCKQCGRNKLMQIDSPVSVAALLAETPGGSGAPVVYWADREGLPAGQTLPQAALEKTLLVLIGPEGGWSDRERTVLRSGQYHCLKLAEHILRIETAAIAAAAVLASLAVQNQSE
ncbi:MAG: RsmE family RNA methyltransferase [bacterium]